MHIISTASLISHADVSLIHVRLIHVSLIHGLQTAAMSILRHLPKYRRNLKNTFQLRESKPTKARTQAMHWRHGKPAPKQFKKDRFINNSNE